MDKKINYARLEDKLRKRNWSPENIRAEIERLMDKEERMNEKMGGFDTTNWEKNRVINIIDTRKRKKNTENSEMKKIAINDGDIETNDIDEKEIEPISDEALLKAIDNNFLMY